MNDFYQEFNKLHNQVDQWVFIRKMYEKLTPKIVEASDKNIRLRINGSVLCGERSEGRTSTLL